MLTDQVLSGNTTYKRLSSGTCYHVETKAEVANILEDARQKDYPLRIFYGDQVSGRDWLEEHDVVGYIGRSTGSVKVPLMIKNRRKSGGPALLDQCIVKIMRGTLTLYQHQNYHLGVIELKPSDITGYEASVYRDGSVHARFKTLKEGLKYVAFIKGEGGNKVDNRPDDEDLASFVYAGLQKYAESKDANSDLNSAPSAVIVGFLKDLKHYCNEVEIDFTALLKKAQKDFATAGC